jgi:hypothetical protein
MRRLIFASLLTVIAVGAAPAQGLDPTDPIRTQDGVRYACTGVGASSREDPRWKEFAAKLVFAAKSGGYLSQVTTTVVDAGGTSVLEVKDCGPWLLLDLPKGRYAVSATAHDGQGRNYEAKAVLNVGGAGQSEAVVRFPDIPG